MRAAILKEYGTTPAVGEWDDPVDRDGGTAVEVLAGGMNPVDRLMATGTYPRGAPTVPGVVGREGIARLPDGSAAYFNGAVPPFGSFAERTLIDVDATFPIPDGLDPALAVCFGISGLAAWLALEWQAKVQKGETVLVLGASGLVGQIGVQAAKLLGAGRVVAAARDEEALARTRELGADETVRLEGQDDLVDQLREACEGGPHVVVDPLWGPPAAAAIAACAEGARHVQIGSSAGQESSIPAVPVRNGLLRILGHTNFAMTPEVLRAAYTRMVEHAAAGELTAQVEKLPLERAAEAWERQADSPRAKLVLVP